MFYRKHKSREARRYRLKSHIKELSKECSVAVLQKRSDRKDKIIDNLQDKLERKDVSLDKKDKQISDLHDEVAKLRLLLFPAAMQVYEPNSEPIHDPTFLSAYQERCDNDAMLPLSHEDRGDNEAMIEMPGSLAHEAEHEVLPDSSQTEEHPIDLLFDCF